LGEQVVNQVHEGEGIGWLKLNRLKKLMEDESYRNFVVSKLNRTLDRKISPDDHIDDVVSTPGDIVDSRYKYLKTGIFLEPLDRRI
jgi:hypothetical protein